MDWVTVDTLHTEVVLDGLNMATWWRRPEAMIPHSDKGWAGHLDCLRRALRRGRHPALHRLATRLLR